jgi:hypothetical protein
MAPGLAGRYLIAFAVGTISGLAVAWSYRLLWSHALIVGIAAAALTYATFRTVDRLRGLFRR